MNLSFQLNDEFVNDYRSLQEPFGFNGLGAVSFYRTYSRKKSNGAFESWVDVCKRVIEGMYSIQKDHCQKQNKFWNENKAQLSAQEAFDRMFNLKWTPSGRGMWMMGTPFIHERKVSEALNNCFTGTTEFITKEYGITRLVDVVDQDVTVYTEQGWKAAKIHHHGKQSVQNIVFRPAEEISGKNGYRSLRSNIRKTVTATPDHKWILGDGNSTTNIQVGDVIKASAVPGNVGSNNYRDGMIHGIVFGDGTQNHHIYKNGDFSFTVRACTEKIESIARMLLDKWQYVYENRSSSNGDTHYTIRTRVNLKDFPDSHNTDYLAGFIDGWMAADASQSSDSLVLSSQNPRAFDWVEANAAMCGYILSGVSYDTRDTNYGPRKNPLCKMTLKYAHNAFWKVESISALDENEDVYCPEVKEIGAFTLSNGMYTGNCAFITTEDVNVKGGEIFEWFMEMLMLGVGVGSDVRGSGTAYVRIPENHNSFNAYVIADSREGWAKSVKYLINSYLYKNEEEYITNNKLGSTHLSIAFDYTNIRPKGTPINGFGGVASGPEPLRKLHERIVEYLGKNDGTTITTRTIVDILNAIGCCVIAGNVRRSAEIIFGDVENQEFNNLKNYEENPERAEIGWASNNSVMANIGDDYTSIASNIFYNGEPGLYWLGNAQTNGRMGEQLADNAIGGNPCMEQPLANREMCNLVEVYMNHHDDLYDYLRTLKFAYLYGKTITLTYDWIRDDETRQIMMDNRRIGLSNTGIAQFLSEHGAAKLIEWLDTGYKNVRHYDKRYSLWLGINESIRVTTVKPSGTVSLLAGSTPGIHHPISEYYIRRIRLQEDTDLVKILSNAGFYIEQDVYSENTVVVEFPIHVGNNIRSESELTIWEQFELSAILQQYWSDNAVSVTVKFDPSKTSPQEIKQVLDYYQYRLKGVSLLPEPEGGAYAQMPYEAIDADTYNTMVSKLDLSVLNNIGRALDKNDQMYELYCTNDACVFVPKK